MKVPRPQSREAKRFGAEMRDGGIFSNFLILAVVAAGYFAFNSEPTWHRIPALIGVFIALTPIFGLIMRNVTWFVFGDLINILNDPTKRPKTPAEEAAITRRLSDAPWWVTLGTVCIWMFYAPATFYAIERLTPGTQHSFGDLTLAVSACLPLVALSQVLRAEMVARPYIAAAHLGRLSSLAALPMALTVRKRLFFALGLIGPYSLTLFAVLTYIQLSGCHTVSEALQKFFSLQVFFIATTTTLSILLALYLLKVVNQPLEHIRQALNRERNVDSTVEGRNNAAGASGALDEFGVVAQLVTERNDLESAKQEFFAVISHELRSPLMSIKAFLSMLSEGSYGALPEKVERKAQIAEQNAGRLVRLINNILDAEKLQSGKFECLFTATDTASIVERAVRAVDDLAEKEGVQVTVDGPQPPEAVTCDEERMVQVLVNFLSNAIKYAGGKSIVVRALVIDASQIELGVQDHGAGLSPEQQDQVFEKFKASSKGTGIGLPIAKALVEQHGGTIGVTSEPDKGCYFWARIPRQQTARTSST